MSRIRAAVVGVGWAGRQHLAAYAAHPDVELVGLAGQEPDVVDALAAQYGVAHRYRDWEELLAWGGFDVLSIAVPPVLHAPIATRALARSVHVLCEKPMAVTLAEAEAMVHAARSTGAVLEVVFNHRWHGEIQAIRDLVRRGRLGTPYFSRVTWFRRNGIPAGGWFLDPRASGGGALADLGVHLVDLGLHLLAEPEVRAVSASAASAFVDREDGVEDFATATLRLAGGRVLEVATSWAGCGPFPEAIEVSVLGTLGGASARVSPLSGPGIVRTFGMPGGESQDATISTPAGRGHLDVVSAFLGRVAAGREDAEAARGLARTRILDAAYRSIRAAQEVLL